MRISVKDTFFILFAALFIIAVTNSMWSSVFLISPTFYPILTLGVCTLLYPQLLLRNKFFKYALIYTLALLLIASFHGLSKYSFAYGNGDFDTVLIESAFLLPSVAISAILYEKNNQKLYSYVARIGLVSIILSIIYILPICLIDASAARLYAERSNSSIDIDATAMNTARFFWNYPMFHAIALLLPVYIVFSKVYVGKAKKIIWIIPVSLFLVIFQSSIATTIFLSVASIIVAYNVLYNKNGKFVYVVEFILLFALYIFLPAIIDALYEYYEGTAMEMKLQDITGLLTGGSDDNGSFSVRSIRHGQAWDCFLSSPIIGTYVPVNGHSTFLNRLGSAGLLGIIPYICFLYNNYKLHYRTLNTKLRPFLNLAWIGAVVLIYSKGLFGQEGYCVILVLVPATLIWLQNRFLRD